MSSSGRTKSFKNVSDINYEIDNDYKPYNTGNDTINETEKELSVFNYLPAIIGVLFIIYILNWLNNIDKCTCSHIDEGKYLKEWFTFFIIIDIIWLFILIALGINNIYTKYIAGFVLIAGFVNFIFIIRTIMYIHKLKKNKCKCGSMFQETSIYSVLLFGVSLIAFALVLLLISFIASFFV
jgi:hypothetical protein